LLLAAWTEPKLSKNINFLRDCSLKRFLVSNRHDLTLVGFMLGEFEGCLVGGAETGADEIGAVDTGVFDGDDEGGAVNKFGDLLGLDEGAFVGLAEGVELGDFVGPSVGNELVLGLWDGDRLGDLEGLLVGCVGETDGEVVGL
jgi:hypothetical protein